jgi:hypothetical protein
VHGRLYHLRHHLHAGRHRVPVHGLHPPGHKKNKIVTQSKNMLRADPEKYDVKKRAPVAG